MSIKNSAGVQFNAATDLIIEADPDGTVTSCRNRANNTEYVGGGDSSLFLAPSVGNSFLNTVSAFRINSNYVQPVLPAVAGDVVSFDTRNKYKVSSITTKDSGVAVTYTTTGETSQGATYTFTMPDEGVLIDMYYDD